MNSSIDRLMNSSSPH